MGYPVGKVRFAAEVGASDTVNESFFSRGGGPIWVKPLWGDPFVVDENGPRVVPNQPSRSVILWGDAERAIFSSSEIEPNGSTEERAVALDLAGETIGDPVVVGTYTAESGAYSLQRVSNGRFVGNLEERGGKANVALFALSDGAKVGDHALPNGSSVVGALGITDDAAFALAAGSLYRFPFDGGAPRITKVAGKGDAQAFTSIGGARRLPIGRDDEVLAQGIDGELVLFSADGAVVFRHDTTRGYMPKRNAASACVGGHSPSGARVVVAIGCDVASNVPVVEEYDRAGELVRRIEWKCGKREIVYDVAITDDGWIALATTHRLEVFAPEGVGAKVKKTKSKVSRTADAPRAPQSSD